MLPGTGRGTRTVEGLAHLSLYRPSSQSALVRHRGKRAGVIISLAAIAARVQDAAAAAP